MKLLQKYSLNQIFHLFIYKVRGFFLFRNSRLIRFPFRLRGKKYIKIDIGFTTGFNCRLDAFNFFEVDNYLIKIGKNVEINDDVHIAAIESVEIGDNVLIASKVFITDHNHGNYSKTKQDSPNVPPSKRPLVSSPVKIEDNVWIGEFVSILPGVTIGKGSIIGTMSVVTKNIPPNSIAVGSPAKVIKKFDFGINEWVSC